ncbi:MAG: hypothetical protein IJD79_09815 [Clostridia bacterium]|nr:hypothetical protein [Clostridia bacterium]
MTWFEKIYAVIKGLFIAVYVVFGVIFSSIQSLYNTAKYDVLGFERPPITVFSSGSSQLGMISFSDSGMQRILVESDKDLFDIDDVSLEVKYGTYLIDEKEKYENKYYDNDFFALYACEEKYQYGIASIDINDYKSIPNWYYLFEVPMGVAFKEEYSFDLKGLFKKIEYQRRVTIKIPKEIFSEEKGVFYLKFMPLEYYGAGLSNSFGHGYSYDVRFSYEKMGENTVDLFFRNEDR